MTRSELKAALRPYVTRTPVSNDDRRRYILPIGEEWFKTNQHRVTEELFEDWNMTMVELLDEFNTQQ